MKGATVIVLQEYAGGIVSLSNQLPGGDFVAALVLQRCLGAIGQLIDMRSSAACSVILTCTEYVGTHGDAMTYLYDVQTAHCAHFISNETSKRKVRFIMVSPV